ncbi:MAG TPA: putative porin [Gammaproteobacteria bacterium]|nr:putative porin [Gammaproteobacteria bacterium]
MKRNTLYACLMGAMLAVPSAHAGQKEDLLELKGTVINLLNALVEQGVLTRQKAQLLVKRAEADAKRQAKSPAASGESNKNVVRVPYVPQFVKDQMREELRAQLREEVKDDLVTEAKQDGWLVPASLPAWAKRFKFGGDIRLRAEADRFGSGNPPYKYFDFLAINKAGGSGKLDNPYLNTTVNRTRLRERLRFGFSAKVTNEVKVAARLSSGNLRDPVSTNQTLGNYFNRYQVVLDRAYLQYAFKGASGDAWLTLWGGRMPNPFYSTDLVWDKDLGFEGLAAKYKYNINHVPFDRQSLFLTVGAFPLQEIALSAHDKWLVGGQVGADLRFFDDSRLRLGLAYYDFRNITGQRNVLNSTLLDYTAPQYMQKGNTLFDIRNDGDQNTGLWALAAKYREINLTASYDFARFNPTHIVLTADYVKNVGFSEEGIFRRTGEHVQPRTTGYQIALKVGMPQVRLWTDWQVYAAYKYLERDAVLDAFTDSDFHLGGTDAKGWLVGGKYAIDDNVWLGARWLSTDAIDGPPLAIDILQLDMNARF